MLPKKLKPAGLYDLLRLGKNNDGGYLVCKNNIEQSDCLVSFGISNDFSFEKQFKKFNSVKIFAYDPTVTNNFFLKEFIMLFLKCNFISLFKSIKNFFDFKKFFNMNDNKLFLKKIGKGGSVYLEHIPFNEIIKSCEENKNIFFKIDIEGSEYRILDELLKIKDKISGIAIEFHDVDLHLGKIVNFTNQIDLTLVHIHANNWMDYGIDNIPTCLEISYSKNPTLISKYPKLPHELDQKNNPNFRDLLIKFKD